MAEKEIGKITHYFSKIKVAAIKLSDSIKVGDRIRIKGNNIDFEQTVDSMQIEHESLQEAPSGKEVGLKLVKDAKENCIVYKIE